MAMILMDGKQYFLCAQLLMSLQQQAYSIVRPLPSSRSYSKLLSNPRVL